MGKRHRRNSGFGLIDVVTALAIVAILAAIAVPSYQGAMYKARRAEGRTFLHTLMMAEERYHASFNRYAANANALGQTEASPPGGHYIAARFELGADGQSVRITVRPQGPQAGDACGDLSLDSTGLFRASGGSAEQCG